MLTTGTSVEGYLMYSTYYFFNCSTVLKKFEIKCWAGGRVHCIWKKRKSSHYGQSAFIGILGSKVLRQWFTEWMDGEDEDTWTDLSFRRHSCEGRRGTAGAGWGEVFIFVVLVCYLSLLVVLGLERFSMFTLMDKCKWRERDWRYQSEWGPRLCRDPGAKPPRRLSCCERGWELKHE